MYSTVAKWELSSSVVADSSRMLHGQGVCWSPSLNNHRSCGGDLAGHAYQGRAVAMEIGVSSGSISTIIHEHLQMSKVSAR